jgi:hypothetical protein
LQYSRPAAAVESGLERLLERLQEEDAWVPDSRQQKLQGMLQGEYKYENKTVHKLPGM